MAIEITSDFDPDEFERSVIAEAVAAIEAEIVEDLVRIARDRQLTTVDDIELDLSTDSDDISLDESRIRAAANDILRAAPH